MAPHEQTSWSNWPARPVTEARPDRGRWDFLRAPTAALRRLLVPAPMVRVGLFFLAEDAPAVVTALARSEACQLTPVPAELQDYLTPCFPEPFRAAFRRLRQHYEPLAQRWRLAGEADLEGAEPHVPSVEEMDRLSEALEPLERQAHDLEQQVRQVAARQLEVGHFQDHVHALAGLGIDVRQLADLRFLHLRSGTVPRENVERLSESAALGDDLVLTLGFTGDRAIVLVVGAGGITPELEGLLSQAQFEPLAPPAFLAGEGTAGFEDRLKEESATFQQRLKALEAEQKKLMEAGRGTLRKAALALGRAAAFAECEGVMEGRSPVAFLSGWARQDRLAELERTLARDVPSPVALLREPPKADERPPSEMAAPGALRAGASLVGLYGSPGYDELNPTLILALTVPLLFGMMFGDVGHGLLLCVAALAGRRWLGSWVPALLSCGLGSVVFGFLYGSVFGVEHWLPAVWLRPMDSPFELLATALWVGVAFVLMTFALKAASLLRQGRAAEAVLGFQAGGGALFYLGAVLATRSLFLGRPVRGISWLLILGGLALVAAHALRELRAHGRAALTDLVAEYFHGGLTLVTNTLSFLRLAAFALAHAALTMALFMLVEAVPRTVVGWAFRVLLLVVGSLGILVLDVLAVAVQTIRLEFYEGLARYYRGDGQAHRPLRFTNDQRKEGTP